MVYFMCSVFVVSNSKFERRIKRDNIYFHEPVSVSV
jgi:hypothetical protein